MLKNILILSVIPLLVGCASIQEKKTKVIKSYGIDNLQEFTDQNGKIHKYTGTSTHQIFGIWMYLGTKGKKHLWLELDNFGVPTGGFQTTCEQYDPCLLYTSDAADE